MLPNDLDVQVRGLVIGKLMTQYGETPERWILEETRKEALAVIAGIDSMLAVSPHHSQAGNAMHDRAYPASAPPTIASDSLTSGAV